MYRVIQKISAAAAMAVLAVTVSGCVTDDDFGVEPRAFGGSKQHPIVVANGKAKVEDCGDWSESVANTETNEMMPNHGCAVQANIAAMAAYPQDLVHPRRQSRPPAYNRIGAVNALGDGGSSGLASTNATTSGSSTPSP